MIEDQLITVDPVDGGWRVGSQVAQPLMFLSGGRAEAHANALAACLASLGHDARVIVRDRAESLIGARRFFAD